MAACRNVPDGKRIDPRLQGREQSLARGENPTAKLPILDYRV
jgi:hypothetical protein